MLDLTRLLPGGFCTMLLADLGADVIKVEDTARGDYLRWAPPFHDGVEPSAASAVFGALNRGKRSACLDLKSDAGREALLHLARHSDVLVESFRPGVLDRLGLAPALLLEANPALLVCSISGFGQDGPDRERPGHDLNYIGLTGLLDLIGEKDGPPVQPPTQIADIGGAWMAAVGILAGLMSRAVTGRGQVVDVSMTHGASAWLSMAAAAFLCDGAAPQRGGLALGGAMICYRPYRCADGWVTLGAVEEKFWRALCLGVGCPELAPFQHDPPGSAAHRQLEAIFAARPRAEWEAFAAEHDCCLEPVLSIDEALVSPRLGERGIVVELDRPDATGPVRALDFPFRLSGTPAQAAGRPIPGLGEHTESVLREADMPDEEIDALLRSGAAAGLRPVAAGEMHELRL